MNTREDRSAMMPGSSIGDGTKKVLKRLRASQPFNSLATSTVRALLSATGLRSEMVIKHLHRMGMVRSELPNGRILRLRSEADDWVSNQIYWRGWSGYEPETAPVFFRLAARASVTIDVGAYVGFFTLLAAHANPRGLVYAFEPLSEVFDRLNRNVVLNELINVRSISCAVGSVEGSAAFYHVPTYLPCSSSLSYEFMRSAANVRSSTVPVIRLDRFVRDNELGRVDLVKIDTESTEPEVLEGMAETIRRDHPYIVCEVLKGRGSEQRIEDLIRSFGYHCYQLTPDGPVQRDHIEGHPSWLNYLFTVLSPAELRGALAE
ncbi:MAG: FkbM family methyltransferase [Blastocatellia bacterium]